jgi:electron transfer flavoprotein alpha subunit
MQHDRLGLVLTGSIDAQVDQAVSILCERGALAPDAGRGDVAQLVGPPVSQPTANIAVLIEPDRPQVAAELLGAAARLAAQKKAHVVAFAMGGEDISGLGAQGADSVVVLEGSLIPEDLAGAIAQWVRTKGAWAILGPSTAFGREVLARAAASLNAGLVGDAVALHVADGALVASKPAFSGALVADISCTSDVQLVTVRTGVLPIPTPRAELRTEVSSCTVTPRQRLRLISEVRDDDLEVLSRAQTVVGVGAGVAPSEYSELSALASVLQAELGATRKVTDNGWAPRSRQIGVTGRSISPRLYVAVGLSGKFNHMVGVRSAHTVLAINHDPEALVFGASDVGIVGDWHEVVPVLVERLRHEIA